MNNTMTHRGPDDSGVWLEDAYGYYIGLAQRRLSIMDLSIAGHQPMFSKDKQYVVVFNGEIYNFKKLREELKKNGHSFVSDCDTEVLLTSYLQWGEDCLNKLQGMFAFAIYDKCKNNLFFARDRIGKKPLYYYHENDTLVFASELKAILKYPYFVREIHTEYITKYLCNKYLESPKTIFKNTYKLESGCKLTWHNGDLTHGRYYNYLQQFQTSIQNPINDFKLAKQELSSLLKENVAQRLDANVPVGVFLSGGIDSTLVAGIAAAIVNKPIHSYTIGFYDKERNEAPAAKEIANRIGTDHTELYVTDSDLLELVDDIPHWFDEPLSDSSQIPTMMVSKLAKGDVTVALSGDGGDEFFCGYNMYDWVAKAQQLDSIAAAANDIIHLPIINKLHIEKALPNIARALLKNRCDNTKVQLFTDVREEYVRDLVKGNQESAKLFAERDITARNWQEKRMLLDILTYLPDEILAKVDRASMKYSLEVRCPILDQSIAEYSFRLPHNFKYRNGEKKWILKQIAYDIVPKKLLDMPKNGFGVPLAAWLRGPLREKVQKYADKSAMEKQGFFCHASLMILINQVAHSNSTIYSAVLWGYLTFQMWYQMYIDDLW